MYARLLDLIGSQIVTLAAQLAYIFAFRAPFERQAATLRARPWACLGWGLALAAAWTALGLAAFHLAAANHNALILILLTVPVYLGCAAGAAVCLSVLAAKAMRWDLQRHPYRCLILGQGLAIFVAALPRLGVALVALYAAAGLGAVLVSEYSSAHDDWHVPRLGAAGLIAMAALTAALSLGLLRASRRLKIETSATMPSAAIPVSR